MLGRRKILCGNFRLLGRRRCISSSSSSSAVSRRHLVKRKTSFPRTASQPAGRSLAAHPEDFAHCPKPTRKNAQRRFKPVSPPRQHLQHFSSKDTNPKQPGPKLSETCGRRTRSSSLPRIAYLLHFVETLQHSRSLSLSLSLSPRSHLFEVHSLH